MSFGRTRVPFVAVGVVGAMVVSAACGGNGSGASADAGRDVTTASSSSSSGSRSGSTSTGPASSRSSSVSSTGSSVSSTGSSVSSTASSVSSTHGATSTSGMSNSGGSSASSTISNSSSKPEADAGTNDSGKPETDAGKPRDAGLDAPVDSGACGTAWDCPDDEACDTTTHMCTTACSASQPCQSACCNGGTCAPGNTQAACGYAGGFYGGGLCWNCGSTGTCGAGNCTCLDAADCSEASIGHACVPNQNLGVGSFCGCQVDTDCPSGAVCDTSGGQCFSCVVDNHTIGVASDCAEDCCSRVCSGPGICGCQSDSDCQVPPAYAPPPTNGPLCNTATHECVACLADSDCGSSGPCDVTTGNCAGCTGCSGCVVGGDAVDETSACATDCCGTVCSTGTTCGCLVYTDCPSGDACDTTTHGCITAYTIGGTVTGLFGMVTLQDDLGDSLTVSNDSLPDAGVSGTGFTFAAPLASSGAYSVTVLTQPACQTCVVAPGTGSGVVGTSNVTSVMLTCTTTTSGCITCGDGDYWSVPGYCAPDDTCVESTVHLCFRGSCRDVFEYACQTTPADCDGTLGCACAGSLCPSNASNCTGATGDTLDCHY